MSLKGDSPAGADPARKLPDLLICRAKRSAVPGMVICLVPDPHECEHSGRFHDIFESITCCLNPQREEIIARNTPRLNDPPAV